MKYFYGSSLTEQVKRNILTGVMQTLSFETDNFMPEEIYKIETPIADGPFAPEWVSLERDYCCPAWFQDAKFGIWSHWGPQSVGQSGDWYGTFMYVQEGCWGDNPHQQAAYRRHIEMFGHPTEQGYKDLLPLWKAEAWQPDELMALYEQAGAKFFVSMGAHHDNFDLWDSAHQPWNSVQIGPKRDIVGDWKQAAEKRGLKFGVSFHADYCWWWWQTAFKADVTGPLAGQPYDAAQNLTGAGTWWEGLDLKDLYGIDLKGDDRAEVLPGRPEMFEHNREFARWYCAKWFRRAQDVLDHYAPDWFYFDGSSYPFSGHGTGKGIVSDATPRILAHFYNQSIRRHGALEAVMCLKGGDWPRRAAVEDYEAHFAGDILPAVWQTDNTIGDWFYYPGMTYSAGTVIYELLEVISRNGIFLLNVPQRPDGTIDPGARRVLEELAAWMGVNGEGVFASRPWRTFGEGAGRLPAGKHNGDKGVTFAPSDMRFTTKGDALYAFVFGRPSDRTVLIRSIHAGDNVNSVHLLGHGAPLDWTRRSEGLEVRLPDAALNDYVFTIKISGIAAMGIIG